MKQSICIIGLGYIGLPTSVMFANHGHRVHGVDVNESVVERLGRGEVTIEEPDLERRLNEVIDNGMLTVATKPQESDVYIVAVPSPITAAKEPNFDYIRSATQSLVPYVKKGDLVILESTVPPRTVADVMIPILEQSGLNIGEELFVAHSPERVIPGRVFEELISNDRIIGGVNERAAEMTADLYSTFVKGKMHLTDATTAELVKVMENTYRDVNIALANELAKIAATIGVDVWEAIQLANYHPRVNLHQPGPGVGGHCIAVDPWFLVDIQNVNTPLIRTARETNDFMPRYTAMMTNDLIAERPTKRVAVLGLAFKGNIDDMRESPSLDVIHYMNEEGLQVNAYDPHILTEALPEQCATLEETVEGAEAIVILTSHDAFAELDPEPLAQQVANRLVIDTKNCLPRERWEAAGFTVQVLGNSKH
ncbi:nucleotide sugar dehydrogenase [Savagea sp. SN6]|uniref:Nucleotide sugar dehydrogenase n=1 Tax=Savagea serpentis TaxID=2785297 RepID=A0A8J7KHR0_9BACL|nr:nucleotide sugar dehydrogenase [Savagea serpentis]MBF4501403.1 nucleotide sugar dehydrogenase [Savagea serpentis]